MLKNGTIAVVGAGHMAGALIGGMVRSKLVPAKDIVATRRSAEALGNPMVGGNSAVLLQNGDEIFPAMLRDIGEAKRTVNLEPYIFLSDEAGRRLADGYLEEPPLMAAQ